jgi:hypothetical protein
MPNSKLDSCTDNRIIHCRAVMLLSPGDGAVVPISWADCVVIYRVCNHEIRNSDETS